MRIKLSISDVVTTVDFELLLHHGTRYACSYWYT